MDGVHIRHNCWFLCVDGNKVLFYCYDLGVKGQCQICLKCVLRLVTTMPLSFKWIVVYIMYNDCLWYDCWYGFFQFLLRWFIFCTMIAYDMIAGMAFFNFYWGGLYFVQWLPMVWLLVWLFSIVIEVVHILYNYAYGMIAGLAFINFYWGGSYFVQWLPMVCRWYKMFRIVNVIFKEKTNDICI